MKEVLNKKIIAIAGIVVCLIGGWYFYRQNISANSDVLTLYGNIENRQVNLSFMVDGKIAKMLKDEGNTVKAGELVAVLDKKDYTANYQVALANNLGIFLKDMSWITFGKHCLYLMTDIVVCFYFADKVLKKYKDS